MTSLLNNAFASAVLILISSIAFSQTLPTIEATAGKGQNVDWSKIEKEENSIEDGPGFFSRDCSQEVNAISASSTLKGQGTKNYGVANLTDNNPMTAWVEGKPGYGIGESFLVSAIDINSIFNGYQSTPLNWKNNSRVKKFKVYVNGKAVCYLALKDEMGEQLFELPFKPNPDGENDFKFEIVDVYKGLKWDDVAISHIDNVGCCFSSETIIELAEGTSAAVTNLNASPSILCINLETGNTFTGMATHVATQKHLSLLKIHTAKHSIQITPDHPLFVKNYGFISIERLKLKLHPDQLDELKNTIEVMVWNEETKETSYEKITDIEKITGEFLTYTIKGLPLKTPYVASGFITTTY